MKLFICGCVLMAFLASCGKDNDVKPNVSSKDIATSTLTPASQPLSTKIFNVVFEIPVQTVITSVNNNLLTLSYTENVSLLTDPAEYEKSWALHLKEDFSQSALTGLDYSTINANGSVAQNWAETNLNNMALKAKKDTTVNGKSYTKLSIERKYTFTKTYGSSELAIAGQSSYLTRTSDLVGLSSYYYSDDSTILPATVKTRLKYIASTGL